MTEDEITQLLDRTSESYTPDTTGALANVRVHAARHTHVRRMASVGLAFLLVAVAATFGIVLMTQGRTPSNPARYLRITPTAQVVPVSAPANGLIDVYFADPRHALGMEPHCSLSPTTNTTCSLAIVRTDDGGRTWTPVGRPLHVTYPNSRASYPFLDFVTNGKDGWIYGSKTYVTHDGGRTFTKSGLGGLVSNLSIVGNETWAVSRPCPPGIPGCSSTVYSTPTSGGPWHPMRRAPTLLYPYLQLLRTSSKDAFLAAQATDGRLYTTTNGGHSWKSHPLPPLCDHLQHLTALNRHDVWALCAGPAPSHSQQKELYHSVDNGSTWVLVATTSPTRAPGVGTLPTFGIVTLLTSVAPDRLLIAFNQGPPIASTDGGKTWMPQGLPASDGVEQLTFTDAQHGWAILLPNYTLYRTSDGGVHWTMAQSH